jgi:hypothetical protein
MSELTASVPPVERNCSIQDVLDGNFIELLQLAPANPLVRAWLLKLCGKQPPGEVLTFDSLKDWIEFNCVKRIKPTFASHSHQTDGISIDVEFAETEYGRCNYSVNCSTNEPFELTEAELLEIVQDTIDDGGGLNSVVESVAEKIEDEAWERCEPSMSDYGDYDYDNHDSQGSEDSSVNFERNQIRRQLESFLQQHHPGLLTQL